ncbi:hypothetical protein BLOT_009825 [Blomia tropicalis]|nr:hypothetical protein BLOT_009825 [Blomia tropicalis]
MAYVLCERFKQFNPLTITLCITRPSTNVIPNGWKVYRWPIDTFQYLIRFTIDEVAFLTWVANPSANSRVQAQRFGIKQQD